MKKIILIFSIGFTLFFSLSMTLWKTAPAKEIAADLNSCVEKADSKWGTECLHCGYYKGYKMTYEDTYKVWMVNQCDEVLDVKCCVQNNDKSWKCFDFKEMSASDTLVAYSCNGTGKYLKWVKKAGDTEVGFPSNDEINEEYKNY